RDARARREDLSDRSRCRYRHQAMMRGRAIAALAIAASVPDLGCRGPRAPRPPVAGAQTSTVRRAGYALRGVVRDRALAGSAPARLVPGAGADGAPHAERPVTGGEARREGALAWAAQRDGTAGPLAMLGALVGARLGGHGSL